MNIRYITPDYTLEVPASVLKRITEAGHAPIIVKREKPWTRVKPKDLIALKYEKSHKYYDDCIFGVLWVDRVGSDTLVISVEQKTYLKRKEDNE